MFEIALETLEQTDLAATLTHLSRQADPVETLKTYDALARHAYNPQKNVPRMIALALAGLQYGLQHAVHTPAGATSDAILSGVKTITYNLAANTWPGWDDEGITLTTTDLALGREAARINLRLAHDLNKPILPQSRAHWLCGAHALAAADYPAAQNDFTAAARLARDANETDEALLCAGYHTLTEWLQSRATATQTRFEAILTQFSNSDSRDFFINQLKTARAVFTPDSQS